MAITFGAFDLTGTSARIIKDTDADATAEKHVSGGACTIYAVKIDNSGNAAESEHIKFYNNGAPTVGTTAPEMILHAYQAVNATWVFCGGISSVFTTSLSVAGTTEAGTAGTTSPGSNVTISVVLEA